jgi:hypothetical protein
VAACGSETLAGLNETIAKLFDRTKIVACGTFELATIRVSSEEMTFHNLDAAQPGDVSATKRVDCLLQATSQSQVVVCDSRS